jgi:hypothetical protein
LGGGWNLADPQWLGPGAPASSVPQNPAPPKP